MRAMFYCVCVCMCFFFFKIAYKQKHDAARGLSDYTHMKEPPEIKHAMEVNKHQSNVSNVNTYDFLENCG